MPNQPHTHHCLTCPARWECRYNCKDNDLARVLAVCQGGNGASGEAGANRETPVSSPADCKAYYDLARSFGLCGRCKQRDALTDMAYCLECRTAIQGYNHKRKGSPRKVYVTKFTVAMRQ